MRPTLLLLALAATAVAAPVPMNPNPANKPLYDAGSAAHADLTVKRLTSPVFLQMLQRMAAERGFRGSVHGRLKGERAGEQRVRVTLADADPAEIRVLAAALTDLLAGKLSDAERQQTRMMSEEMIERMDRLKMLMGRGARLPEGYLEWEQLRLAPYLWEQMAQPVRKVR